MSFAPVAIIQPFAMAKHTKFDPYYRKGPPAVWILNIPAGDSRTGKRRRLQFTNREEALKTAAKLKARRKKYGTSLTNMDAVRMAESDQMYREIEAHNQKTGQQDTLVSIVRGHILKYEQRHQSVSLPHLFDEFLQAKAHRVPRYLEQIKQCRAKFASLDGSVSDLHPSDLKPILDQLPRGTRNPYLRYLRAVLNFGVKQGYLKDNPAKKVDFAHVSRKEVQTFPNHIIKGLFDTASKEEPELIPFLVLTAFLGVRPDQDGEVFKILWGDLKLDQERKELVIRAEVSKTRRKRVIPVPDNAVAWLEWYRKGKLAVALQPERKVIKLTPNAMIKARQRIFKQVSKGKLKWPNSVLRHCFASNRLPILKNDINALTLELGHRDPDMLWDHYYAHTSLKDAQEYFSIYPPKSS